MADVSSAKRSHSDAAQTLLDVLGVDVNSKFANSVELY